MAEKKRSKAQKEAEKNLIQNKDLTPNERRKSASNAGKASGEARRKKKELKDCFEILMALPPSDKDKQQFSKALGIPEEQLDSNQMIMSASMYNQARKGNVKAFELVNRVMNGDSPLDKEELKLKQQELRMKQEIHEIEMEKIQAEKEAKAGSNYKGIPALSIAPPFNSVLHDIYNHEHLEYCFRGGRGSTKSSFVSLAIIDLVMRHDNLNALVLRQVSNTISGSVYNQLVWGINELGLTDDFKCTKNPAEITRKSTGQVIFFRGADDTGKIKSIKPTKGYIGILWFEELDQFNGPESVRNIEQSAMRGGDDAWVFKSFNPPKSAINWANKYVLKPSEKRLDQISTYIDVPPSWLGKDWIASAEELKEVNPTAYENEYLGKANGTGGSVFDNVTVRKITQEERKEFDRIYEGVDWGWYPDPFHFSRMHYDSARMKLYIYGELRENKKSNEETAQAVRGKFDLKDDKGNVIQSVDDGIIYCDSAEPKSIADWKTYGMPAKKVEKGPDSVKYSMKWLQSLNEIIIDSEDCPNTAEEFTTYEYDRDKDGNVISGYPDKNNHAIDSVRYAMFPVWRKRGQ